MKLLKRRDKEISLLKRLSYIVTKTIKMIQIKIYKVKSEMSLKLRIL